MVVGAAVGGVRPPSSPDEAAGGIVAGTVPDVPEPADEVRRVGPAAGVVFDRPGAAEAAIAENAPAAATEPARRNRVAIETLRRPVSRKWAARCAERADWDAIRASSGQGLRGAFETGKNFATNWAGHRITPVCPSEYRRGCGHTQSACGLGSAFS